MKSLVEKFYQSFSDLNAEAMVECYHENIRFKDPGFGWLEGPRAGNMWRMLLNSQKGKEFKVIFSDIEADDQTGKAHWEAFYTFSQTGRKVHNKIDAQFRFQDGKIIEHIDHFNLWRWAGMAMGPTGYLLGWSGFFKNKLQTQTNKLLSRYESSLRA
ncbi:MAG: nuclear transport factor 2 family protein [Bacteroidota bacterium]